MRTKGTIPSIIGGLVLVLLASPSRADRDDDNLRRDVLLCEDAISHAKTCCGPAAVAGLECYYLDEVNEGCGTTTVYHQDPDLYIDESDCIRSRSCGDLKASVCAKLAALPRGARRTSTSTPSGTSGTFPSGSSGKSASGHAAVCP